MDIWEQFKANFKRMAEKDAQAKKAAKLVGRYLQEQIADGYSYYVIVRENKKTVRVKHAKDIGDDYRVPYWGDAASVDKEYAIHNINQRDWWEGLREAQGKPNEEA